MNFKYIIRLILCASVLLMLACGSAAADYWNTSWLSRQDIILTGNTSGVQTDYQILLNVSWVAGMQADFDDLRFANDTHKIGSWLESKVDGSHALVWVEFPTTPADGINQTYYMYYGNVGAVSDWNATATFTSFFDGDSAGWIEEDPNSRISFVNDRLEFAGLTRAEAAYVYKPIIPIQSDWIAEWTVNISSVVNTAHIFTMGISSEVDDLYSHSGDSVGFDHYYGTTTKDQLYIWEVDEGSSSSVMSTGTIAPNTRYMRSRRIGNMVYCTAYSDAARTITIENEISKDITGVTTANLDNYFLLSTLHATGSATVSGYVDDHICRKCVTNPPTATFEDTQYYTDTMYYNKTSPYNHTIDSAGAIAVNRTKISVDGIGWSGAALTDDCHIVITDYNLINDTVAAFELYEATLDHLTVTDLHASTFYILQFPNGTIIEAKKSSVVGKIIFTTNIDPGSYQIKIHIHPFLFGAYSFYYEMETGLTDFKDGMGKYLIWGVIFFGVGLAFAIFAKIKQTLIGGK